ncbi:mannose-1-phosphate guanylyltransferase/mannose-6-phosphate isomerase [Alsobacter metallidurans]|uniref:mannose-1-phosphate guanylyltransferase n=1 Tax=Alsobacter metallidurans TaxID=340221 RepID=A0A917I736_9HYPH|nr:mannose-1-phosphate guanylyltransferase/mannose-6-phosphate isomerase [Alsobacter metallidurans]GGH16915.1 mannose-1-phosphate guanylyltransferase/mannose-6-phosphate isomerase [Alsobacter metallidurans]
MPQAVSDALITPVILCGGSGTRLWPASRKCMPKQFIPLTGPLSMFQDTVKRVSDPACFAAPIVVTSDEFRFVVAEQLREIDTQAEIVLEPSPRDSGPAVAVAAVLAGGRHKRGLVLILPSDHLIPDAAAFTAACVEAAKGAQDGFIMTLGVAPTGPATGYGYIRPSRATGSGGALAVEAFVEKPDLATAKTYVEQGYLWNSGNFLFRADVMLDELSQFAPDMRRAAEAAVAQATRDLDFLRLDGEAFAAAPKKSIDYAVLEHTRKAAVLPVSFRWSDLGEWDAVLANSERDANGNSLSGNVHVRDANNSLVHSEGMLTAVLGLDDVVVVTTQDAVLVTSRAASPQVKDLVESLKASGHAEATEHLRMHRPWGWYQRVDIGTRFQVKRIMVRPGAQLSLQKHFHRAEHWVVVRGTAEVTRDAEVLLLQENESVYLPLGCVHRLTNPGKIPLELIEVQVGSYTGEDDIVRITDVYGRSA